MSITQTDLERIAFDETADPMVMPLSLLEQITNGFSDKLETGRGGFSVVYKGMLDNGAVIAIKRLSSTYKVEKEFQQEIEFLMRVKHNNIVRFLGYCTDTQVNMVLYDGNWVMAETQQKLLCFEYLPKGSLKRYIKDPSGGLAWRKRYRIIKGICEGLSYLHHNNILHLDLKPANILLDEDMMPKINDFGLSRRFEEKQTGVTVTKMGGTIGYLAPEFTSHVITHKFDLYSLGVIIIEILTGKRGHQNVENVLESWRCKSDISQWGQIRVCAEIGMECTNFDPAMRPLSMKHIIDRLLETESAQLISACPSDLLVHHPFSLCFHFEPNKASTCQLQLGNNTDKQVAFRLRDESEESFLKLPLYGAVPPRSSYTLIVTTKEYQELAKKSNMDVILTSAMILRGDSIDTFQLQPDYFFQEAKSMGNMVQEVIVKATYTPRQETIYSSKVIQGLSGPVDVDPLELCFPFEHDKSIPCLLHLKNNTDDHVAFNLNEKSQWVLIFPIYSLIPPRSTHSVLVMAQRRKMLPETSNVLTLQSRSISNDDFTKLFTGDCEELWNRVKESESENTVHEITLQAIYTPHGQTTSKAIPLGIKIISVLDNLGHLLSVDANTTKPWMVVRRSGHAKIATIMNYVTQEQMGMLEATTWGSASSPKFIGQREWILAPSANDDGHIHVYNYEMEKIDALKAGHYAVTNLAVHPTKLNVLSVCWAIKEIKLWDYEDGWKLSRTFVSERLVNQVVFNQKDTNINAFASSCVDHRVELWDLDSSECSCTLTGHQDQVNCLEFFTREGQQQYLVTGSNDKTAKIWDIQTMTCAHTLEGFMSPVMCVFGHPNLRVLFTGTEDGIIHLWSSTDFRLMRTLNMGSCGEVLSIALACPVESGRGNISHGFWRRRRIGGRRSRKRGRIKKIISQSMYPFDVFKLIIGISFIEYRSSYKARIYRPYRTEKIGEIYVTNQCIFLSFDITIAD